MFRKINKISLTITIHPKIVDYLREVQSDQWEDSRSRLVQSIIVDWLYDYGYISDSEMERLKRGEYDYEEV